MGGRSRRAGAETEMGWKVKERTEQKCLSKDSVEKKRGNRGATEKHRVKGRLFVVLFRRLNQVKSLLMGRLSLREYISNCLSFIEIKRHDCLQRKRSTVFL